MSFINSFELVIFTTNLFGVNQGYTGRYVGRRTSLILAIFNICLSLALLYLNLTTYAVIKKELSPSILGLYLYLNHGCIMIVLIQICQLLRNRKKIFIVQELIRFQKLSSWTGDNSGLVIGFPFYVLMYVVYATNPGVDLPTELENQFLIACSFWIHYSCIINLENLRQIMMLFEYELKKIRYDTVDMIKRRDCGIEKLRTINRRHASLSKLMNTFLKYHGTDYLINVQNQKTAILMQIFLTLTQFFPFKSIAEIAKFSLSFFYRFSAVTCECFRAHKIIVETRRFRYTLDEINILDIENDEYFTEFQIIRKQVKLRKMCFNCNGYLKLNMKLIYSIISDILTLTIVIFQLKRNISNETTEMSNLTEAVNFTRYFVD